MLVVLWLFFHSKFLLHLSRHPLRSGFETFLCYTITSALVVENCKLMCSIVKVGR